MALASAVSTVHRDLRAKSIVIKATPTGNYATGGDTLNLAAATSTVGQENASFGYPGTITDYAVQDCPAGYTAKLVPGTNLTNWKLKVFETGSALSGPLLELPAAAYPAGVLADVFTLRFRGPKFRI